MEASTYAFIMGISGCIIFPISFNYFKINIKFLHVIILSIVLAVSCYLLPAKLFLISVGITAVAGTLLTKNNDALEVFKAILAVLIVGIPLTVLML